MYRWLLLALPLLCAGPACAAGDLGDTPQLHPDPGFEEGTGETAGQWGLWPPAGKEAGVSSARDARVKHAGAFSGRLRVTRDDFKGVCTWHHPAVPVHAGQELMLRFWWKAEAVSEQCGCDVQLRQGDKIVGGAGAPAAKGTFDWTQVTHRFTVPAGVDQVCVVPLLRGKGAVWFDDAMLFGTPSMAPVQLEKPPTIDGDLSEACWAPANAVSGFVLADGSGLPERGTRAWVACDAGALYFAFRCEKKPGDRLRKSVTKRDGVVWGDDEVEVFLNPGGDGGDYYQFIVNPLGTRYDSHRTDAGWNADWRAAAKDARDAWTVEMAIPVAGLPLDLTVGKAWCANLGRGDKAAGQASSWSCAFGGFHSPGRFGRLAEMALNLAPFYEKDARARVAAVRGAYRSAAAGLDPASAPAEIAAPFREREPRIRAGLEQLEGILQQPAKASDADWARVRPAALALAAEIEGLRAAGMRLRTWTLWRDAAIPRPRFGLATAPAMVKVRKDGQDFAGTPARDLTLSAARNEYEGAQVVAVSLSREDVPDCRVEVSALQGPRGAVLPAANVTVGLVSYIGTGKPGYQTAYVGDWPDPIFPYKPFTLKAGEVQPLWLRCYVPAGARPGDYRGTVTVSGGGERHEMALALHVFDFALPRRQHLATPFGCNPASLSQWYTGSGDYQAKMPPEVWNRWNRFLLDYRLTPTHVGTAYLKEIRDPRGQTRYDYSATDQCIAAVADRLPLDGTNMASIGNLGWTASNGATCKPVAGDAHTGKRAGKVTWPKTESWAALDRFLPGEWIAGRNCRAFRFWVKALDASAAGESIVAFVNAFPNRWITTFPVGGTEWHEVRLPIAQYHHNTTGAPLSLDALKTCADFQFVISKKARPIEFLVDDIVAECADGDVAIDDFEVESEVAQIRNRMGAQLRHWKEKGWFSLGHVYAKDEIQPAEYDQVLPSYRRALDAAPDAPLMQTYNASRTPQEMVGLIRVWCALTASYDEEFLSARRAAGEKLWLYVCCGPTPPYANFFIDQPGSDHRVLFWQTWQRRATGLLYWETDYWHGMMPLKPDEPRWPDVPWDQEKVATYREFKVNGDGFLIYPGPDWTPWPSVRLENIRDGIEDYEYLWLLRERDPKNALLTVGDDISKDFTHYCKDPQVILQRRLAVARAIEKAKRK